MTDLNIDSFSLKELQALQKSVAKAIASFEERRKSEARAKIEALAREMGFTINDFAGEAGPKVQRSPASARYRHPDNAEITWSGRGRKPRWYVDHLAAGRDPSLLDL